MQKSRVTKVAVCGILFFFVGTGIISGVSGFDEIVDQHQDNFYTGQGFTVNVNEYGKEHVVAQSFKPSMTPLTKVDLVILTSVFATLPVIVSIRDSLEGNDLTSITTPPDQIPQDNASWHTFDFPDITVVPENTYYIIIRSNETFFGYFIGFFNSVVDNYPRGAAWSYYDGNWTLWDEGSNYFFDCAFRTYSNNQPPNPPIINGPSWGQKNINYTFCITLTSPESDDFYCRWNWSDGIISEWLGPYSTGQTICANHSWSQKGTYEIRVDLIDVYHGIEIYTDPHIFNVYELKQAIIFGRFTNLTEEGGLNTIEAINLRLISFKPFQFVHYTNGEKITYFDDTIKLMILNKFIIGVVNGVT